MSKKSSTTPLVLTAILVAVGLVTATYALGQILQSPQPPLGQLQLSYPSQMGNQQFSPSPPLGAAASSLNGCTTIQRTYSNPATTGYGGFTYIDWNSGSAKNEALIMFAMSAKSFAEASCKNRATVYTPTLPACSTVNCVDPPAPSPTTNPPYLNVEATTYNETSSVLEYFTPTTQQLNAQYGYNIRPQRLPTGKYVRVKSSGTCKRVRTCVPRV